MYCECFNKGLVCGKDCGCTDCDNLTGNDQIIANAREEILIRNPKAFNLRLLIMGNSTELGASVKRVNAKRITVSAINQEFLVQFTVSVTHVRTVMRALMAVVEITITLRILI